MGERESDLPIEGFDPSTDAVDLGRVSLGGELEMQGLHLVRHHLQQAQSHAAYLPGGDGRDTVLGDDVLTPEQAAEGVREDIEHALAALEALLGAEDPEPQS